MGNKFFRNIWANKLKVKYIDDEDMKNSDLNAKITSAYSNVFWNSAVRVYAYTAVPLMHLALPLAVCALYIFIRRKWLIEASIIFIPTMMYVAYYFMLTTLTVASGYDAFKISYFIPAYAPIVFTSFASVSLLFNFNKIKPDARLTI